MITKRETLDDLIEAAREHNLRANRAEGENSRCKETIAQMRLQMQQLEERAEFAELTVKGLTETNGALWGQNERLLGIVAEMRRAGFELVRPEMIEPNDEISSVEQDDASALEKDKTLIATSDD